MWSGSENAAWCHECGGYYCCCVVVVAVATVAFNSCCVRSPRRRSQSHQRQVFCHGPQHQSAVRSQSLWSACEIQYFSTPDATWLAAAGLGMQGGNARVIGRGVPIASLARRGLGGTPCYPSPSGAARGASGVLGWPQGTFRDTGLRRLLNMTQVEIAGPLGGSRCMVTGSQGCGARIGKRTVFRRFPAQLHPGCQWGRQRAR